MATNNIYVPPGRKSRILAILDTVPVGGPGKGVIQIATNIDAQRFDFRVSNFTYPKREDSRFNLVANRHGVPVLELQQAPYNFGRSF